MITKKIEQGQLNIESGTIIYSNAHAIEGTSMGIHLKIVGLDVTTIDITILEGNDIDILNFGEKTQNDSGGGRTGLGTVLSFTLNNGNYFIDIYNVLSTTTGFKINPKTNTTGSINYTLSQIIQT